MKAQNFFPDQVQVCRPVFFPLQFIVAVTHAGHVARQRVVPHVKHVLLVPRPGNSPLHRCAAHGKVSQPALHERHHFVSPSLRLHEFRMLFVKVQQPPLKRRKLEVIVFLANLFERALALRAKPALERLIHVHFIVNAVEPFILALVDESVVHCLQQQAMHRAVVSRLGGADETVNPQAKLAPQRAVLS